MRPVGFGYRPALDGVRALAVTAVVLFHGGVPGLRGGFLGVDAFFVLSGYLITALLLAEYDRSGRISLPDFWGRRARRLLPALLLVLVAVVLAGRYLVPDTELGLLRWDALAALGYLANWRMIWRGTGYFAQNAAPSPLQHTWSLGIEEQFYWVWPVAMGFLARYRRAIVPLCLAGALGSAYLDAVLYRPDDVDRAYFGTDTRAQALLIGCALAALPLRPGRYGRRFLGGAAIAGTVATAWLWTHADGTDGWLYRGGLTVAALAVAAVLAHAVASPTGPTARVLSLPPLVWLGRISYGVYLWHWPLFQFLTAARTGLAGPALLGIRCAATLSLATASYFLVEQPIRRGVLLRRAPRFVPAAVLATAFGAVIAIVGVATLPPPPPKPAAAVTIPHRQPAPVAATSDTRPPPMRRSGRIPGADPRVAFYGDSVAWTLGTYLPPHPGLVATDRAVQGCGIALLPDILEEGGPHTNYPYCVHWPDIWSRDLANDDPDVAVILLDRWELMDRRLNGVYQHVGQPAFDAYLLGQLDQAVSIVDSRGARVVLLTAPYTHRAEKPDGSLYPEDDPARVDAWNALLRTEAARHPEIVSLLDLNRVVCPQGTFTWTVAGVRVRSDGLHFTPAGVQRVIAPWLLPRLATLAET